MWFLGKFHIRWYNINDFYRVSSNYIVKIFPTYFKCFSNFPRVHFFVQLKEIETSPLKKKGKKGEKKKKLWLIMVPQVVVDNLSITNVLQLIQVS